MKLHDHITGAETVGESKTIESDCVAIMFISYGDNTAVINGSIKLTQNQSITISQQPGGIDRTQYDIFFRSDGSTSELCVVKIKPQGVRS